MGRIWVKNKDNFSERWFEKGGGFPDGIKMSVPVIKK